tara:strand:+ start:985 stop:1251 length:267 start_codon:yes stop_codon:yes gene_type:complete
MALTKQTYVDKIELVKISNHWNVQIRNVVVIFEDGVEISSDFTRDILTPDADVSTITDPVVLAQFNAVMTDEVKTNYQTFLTSQSETE